MESFKIRPLSEADIDTIIRAAGGRRAHPDADRRDKPGSDYQLNESLLELKSLDDEGFAKPERQAKLASLFDQHEGTRPVIVLDRDRLSPDAQRDYDRILEGPIKSAVAKARKQLKQSRAEYSAAAANVLFVANNGYTALDHEALCRMVAHRARNDSAEIDAVVVAGCYFYSDTFDSYFLWPIDCIPINLNRPFTSFDKLKSAWNAFAQDFMTNVVQGIVDANAIKGPIVDSQFDLGGITYVKPAPPMGLPSGFFHHGRPRSDSTGMKRCPPVARVFPDIGFKEWESFRVAFASSWPLSDDFAGWQRERAAAAAAGEILRPFVPMPITFAGWDEWRRMQAEGDDISVSRYATEIFNGQVRDIATSSRERTPTSILPARYVLAVTEEIGQDRANDVSHIAFLREIPGSEPDVRELVVDARLFHEHAVAVASAYAIANGVASVLWQKDLTYAWLWPSSNSQEIWRNRQRGHCMVRLTAAVTEGHPSEEGSFRGGLRFQFG